MNRVIEWSLSQNDNDLVVGDVALYILEESPFHWRTVSLILNRREGNY